MTSHADLTHASRPPNGVASRGPRWASALVEHLVQLAGPLPPEVRNQVRCTAWPVLRTALTGMVRQLGSQLGPVSIEAVEDIAADKSLELMLRCEAGRWNPRGWSGAQLGSFLSRVARNGVIDHLRTFGPRRVATSFEDGIVTSLSRYPDCSSNPVTLMEAAEFARHLLEGLHRLKPRARTVWFLRVCFDWPSRRIARYPGVEMPASHVDVELQRARSRIRAWMESAGFDIRDIPPGTFAALWNACLRDDSFPPLADAPGEAG